MIFCSQLLETNLPVIDLHDKVEQVLLTFEAAQVDSLPVMEGAQFLGMIQEEDLFDFSPSTEVASINMYSKSIV
jgi:predicted transcriptional regulator